MQRRVRGGRLQQSRLVGGWWGRGRLELSFNEESKSLFYSLSLDHLCARSLACRFCWFNLACLMAAAAAFVEEETGYLLCNFSLFPLFAFSSPSLLVACSLRTYPQTDQTEILFPDRF
jgi:hypothetical protein